jgi:hypothetical protein
LNLLVSHSGAISPGDIHTRKVAWQTAPVAFFTLSRLSVRLRHTACSRCEPGCRARIAKHYRPVIEERVVSHLPLRDRNNRTGWHMLDSVSDFAPLMMRSVCYVAKMSCAVRHSFTPGRASHRGSHFHAACRSLLFSAILPPAAASVCPFARTPAPAIPEWMLDTHSQWRKACHQT